MLLTPNYLHTKETPGRFSSNLFVGEFFDESVHLTRLVRCVTENCLIITKQ